MSLTTTAPAPRLQRLDGLRILVVDDDADGRGRRIALERPRQVSSCTRRSLLTHCPGGGGCAITQSVRTTKAN